jgi:threonine/homoserine/homoserine lactone efflux protein
MFVYLMQGLGYGFAAAVQPGPFQTYVISQSLRQGWRNTLPASLAPLISDGPIILLALVVLSRFPAAWERVLYVAGGVYVLYLALGAFRAWRLYDTTGPRPEPVSGRQGVMKAALMNALSPGPYLYWGLVTGPLLFAGWCEAPARGLAFLAGFYGAMIASLVALIVVFSTARRLGPIVTRALVGLSALALLGFGILQLVRGII